MTKTLKKRSIFVKFRNYFIAGIVVLIPIGITIYLTLFIIKISSKLLPKEINPNHYLPYDLPGVEILISIRSLINLSSQINASVDHVNSRFFFTNMNIIQRSGYMATSLMEVKNRSDVILIFGNKIMEKSARLFERAIFPNSSLFVKKNKKKVFLIGELPERELKFLKNKTKIVKHPVIDNLSTSLMNDGLDRSMGAIFLDRDGTINIDSEFIDEINKIKIPEKNLKAIKHLSSLGYLNIIITNQSGVGYNYFSLSHHIILIFHFFQF